MFGIHDLEFKNEITYQDGVHWAYRVPQLWSIGSSMMWRERKKTFYMNEARNFES